MPSAKRILVLDDDWDRAFLERRKVLEPILSKHGEVDARSYYSPEALLDVDGILADIERRQPDLIVSDLDLADGGDPEAGRSLVYGIRKTPALADTPIIVISTWLRDHHSDRLRAELRSAGIGDDQMFYWRAVRDDEEERKRLDWAVRRVLEGAK